MDEFLKVQKEGPLKTEFIEFQDATAIIKP